MYRPEGFKNPYVPDGCATEEYLDHGARDMSIFEAGADAILKGLEKRGFKFYENGEFQIPIKSVDNFKES